MKLAAQFHDINRTLKYKKDFIIIRKLDN